GRKELGELHAAPTSEHCRVEAGQALAPGGPDVSRYRGPQVGGGLEAVAGRRSPRPRRGAPWVGAQPHPPPPPARPLLPLRPRRPACSSLSMVTRNTAPRLRPQLT